MDSPFTGTWGEVKVLRAERRYQAYRRVVVLSAFLALACAGCLPWSSATPTPVAVVEFQVNIIYPTSTTTPTATATQTPAPTVAPTPTPFSQPSATSNPTATSLPLLETPGLGATPAETITTATAQIGAGPTSVITATRSLSGWVPGGGITLVELPDKIALPVDVGRVEFKWVWNGHGCTSPPEGQAFEIRIWPDLPGVTPLGVMDASKTDAIVCDEKSGTRSYEVGNLRGAPGISSVKSGRFRWHVALVELDSETLIAVSESRAFDLPPGIPTPTPTATPPRVVLVAGQDPGTISLEEPADNYSLPEGTQQFEFRWRWSLAGACELPPPGYGFELRIWPEHPDMSPEGVMGDASASQADVFCDPSRNLFGYRVMDLEKTRAVIKAGAGRFRWDVILVKLDPYEIVVFSGSRAFELPGESRLK